MSPAIREAVHQAIYHGAAVRAPHLRLRYGAVKCMALLLVLLFLVGTAWPSTFKQMAGFAVFALLLTAMAAVPVAASKASTRVLIASLTFVGFGAVILVLSAFGVFGIDPTLPVRNQYMPRQAYFLFLWFPFLLGAAGFWNVLGLDIFSVCRRWGIPLLVMLAVADLATARLFGNPSQLAYSGYLYFLDKFGLQFVFSLVYLIYVSHTRRWLLCLLLITVYAAVSKLFHFGIMFNATTGAIFYLFLATSTIPLASRRLQAIGVVFIYLALVAFLVFGMLFPGVFSSDNNDSWRLMAWRSNLATLWHSGLAGVGFGTPYFSITSDNMLNSMNNHFDSLSADMVSSVDQQYVRAQHSSIVNMFYRLGVIGGAIFLYLNILIARIGFANLTHPNPSIARMGYASFVLFVVQAVQMTVHVGLETPIFLSIYMLAATLILHVNAVAAGPPPRPPRHRRPAVPALIRG
jgi:hypothetical protein